jgi:hypothetical protein
LFFGFLSSSTIFNSMKGPTTHNNHYKLQPGAKYIDSNTFTLLYCTAPHHLPAMTSYIQARNNLQAKNGKTALPVHSSEGDTTIPVSFDASANASAPSADHIDHGVTQAPYEKSFSPYDFNGGTTLAISGEDYAIVAADTRLSSGYEILSRNVTKLHALTPRCVLGSAGCKTDIDQLRSVLDINMKVSLQLKLISLWSDWFRSNEIRLD